jgi:hypothetical protein
MRPTKDVKYLDGNVRDKPEWKSKKNWLHWDQNPWQEPDFVRVQGLVALTNTPISRGGIFHHKSNNNITSRISLRPWICFKV